MRFGLWHRRVPRMHGAARQAGTVQGAGQQAQPITPQPGHAVAVCPTVTVSACLSLSSHPGPASQPSYLLRGPSLFFLLSLKTDPHFYIVKPSVTLESFVIRYQHA